MLLGKNKNDCNGSCRRELMYTFVDEYFDSFQAQMPGPSGLFGNPGAGGAVVRLRRRQFSRPARGACCGRRKLARFGSSGAHACRHRHRHRPGRRWRAWAARGGPLRRANVRRADWRDRRTPRLGWRAGIGCARVPGTFDAIGHHGRGGALSGPARFADPGPAISGDGIWRHVGLQRRFGALKRTNPGFTGRLGSSKRRPATSHGRGRALPLGRAARRAR